MLATKLLLMLWTTAPGSAPRRKAAPPMPALPRPAALPGTGQEQVRLARAGRHGAAHQAAQAEPLHGDPSPESNPSPNKAPTLTPTPTSTSTSTPTERRARLLAPQGHVWRRARLLLVGPRSGLPDAQVQQGQAQGGEGDDGAGCRPQLVRPIFTPYLHPATPAVCCE